MRKYIFIILLSLCATYIAAQLPHTYSCDFESATENANWNLNIPKNENYEWVNQWAIGDGIASLGEKSMYISADGGTTAAYKKSLSRIMIAWRELTMESGRYDLAFDWQCGGDSVRAALLVAWVPQSQFENMVCKLSDNYASEAWIQSNLLTFNGVEILTGGSVWTHAVQNIQSDGTPHRLVFLYTQSSTAQIVQPGACVDNIQLSRNNCGIPTQMETSTLGQTARLKWNSTADAFNLRFHRMGDTDASEVKNIKTNSYTATLPIGVYDVQIQVICGEDTSVWYNFPMIFIHEALCFDYLDLDDDRCYYSAETASDYTQNDSLLVKGKIDNGFTSMFSRHTIHYHPEEYDARTRGSINSAGEPVPMLKTVPDGALASVRVGSWEKMARVARIEYDFMVDAKQAAVLMLKYAMVLESSGHTEEQRPRLMIDIVDANTGQSLSTCTTVDLASQTSGEGWNRVPDGGDGSRDVCWRDWTTLGLNLADYDGRRVKVKITAIGCTAEIHYSYAYFTLTCASGKLEGIQCGNTPTNEFIAPDGFDYRWYLLSNPSATLSRDRVYPVDYRDTRDYAVDVTYKSNANCRFTLYANAIPRFPVPEATFTLSQHDCGNYITFNNNSHIRTRDWNTGQITETTTRPDLLFWDFDGLVPEELVGDSIPWNPSFRLPDEEADYHFTLRAQVGLCDSIQHIYVHVPRVGKDSIVEKVQRCEGDIFVYNGKYYAADADIIDEDYNRAGCDSIHVINLRFVESIRDTIEAIIPEGESYRVGNQSFNASGEYEVQLTSAAGCDSIVLLNLKVVVPLRMDITVESPCPEDPSFLIYAHARSGEPNYYSLSFDESGQSLGLSPKADSLSGGIDNTIEIPLPAGIKPNFYPFTISFNSKENGNTELNGELMVHYSASLIQQRWDDVLGILNANYNGGYDFVTFQWYRNGQIIAGATNAYLYEENKLQPGDEYVVELGLPEQTRTITTCAFVVPASASPSPSRAPQKIMHNGQLLIYRDGRIYNAQGRLIETEHK